MDIEKVRITFMVPKHCSNETECSEHMIRAYEACRQNAMNVHWVKEQNYSSIDLQKSDFVVFTKFEGKCFDAIKDTKCTRIVGPWCLLSCLTQGRPIPNHPWPIFNVAMSECFVTSSNLTKNDKQEIKHKVQCMGGQYSDSLLSGNTHLVTDTVKSKKYAKAAEAGLKIMLKSWVDVVWVESSKRNVHCNDEQFQSERCLPFNGLTICCTGLSVDDRKLSGKAVVSNGGIFKRELRLGKTDVLVCKEGVSSDKIKAARKLNTIKCVTFKWITDSVEEGYALPEDLYSIKKATSTPTKSPGVMDPNFSIVSAIISSTPNRSVLQETVNTNTQPDIRKRRGCSMEELSELVDQIDLKRAKTSGSFLDGCSIYFVGFGASQRDKISKILKFSGATRYDNVSDLITHVIVGDTSCREFKSMQSKNNRFYFVTLKWLTDSMEQRQPVPEANYVIDEFSSPCNFGSSLAKKGLQLLRANASVMDEDSTFVDPKTIDTENIVQKYLRPGEASQEDTIAQFLKNNSEFNKLTDAMSNKSIKNKSTHQSQSVAKDAPSYSVSVTSVDESSRTNLIFQGLKFLVSNFNEEECGDLITCIELYGGEIVPKLYKGVLNYAVFPAFDSELINTAEEVITDYYITDCVREDAIIDIEYYHRPVSVDETNPIRGCVVTISTYFGNERMFLINLIQRLGGISQEQLSRVARSNVLRSTHLLSPDAAGKKYVAALKWGLPVVNKDWLLECARTGSFVSEKEYLIGDAKVSDSSQNPIAESVRAGFVTSSFSQPNITERKRRDISTPANDKSSDCSTATVASGISSNVDENYSSAEKDASTPKKLTHFPNSNRQECKLLARIMQNSPEVCSQITPAKEIMQEVRMNHILGTPPRTPPMPKRWNDVATPDTPYGAFIRPNPSPHLRKEMLKWIKRIPDYNPRRNSTPLSELKRQLWDKICPPRDAENGEYEVAQPDFSDTDDESETFTSTPPKLDETPDNSVINKKLLHLHEMLASSGGSNSRIVKKRQSTIPVEAAAVECNDSQVGTVDWDYMECDNNAQENKPKKRKPLFMISGADAVEKQILVSHLEGLGASVSDLPNYDPACTHLICTKPSRNEKLLAAMAAGKWILHVSYIQKSVDAGRLLDEEEFEYGNSKSQENITLSFNDDTVARTEAIHWWRKEVEQRGYGAFHDMRAIVVSIKRDSVVHVIEAGGGTVIDVSPPFDETVHATHCLLDLKTVDMSLYEPLAKQGIYCVNTVYVNNVLRNRNFTDIRHSILPYFYKYYVQE